MRQLSRHPVDVGDPVRQITLFTTIEQSKKETVALRLDSHELDAERPIQ